MGLLVIRIARAMALPTQRRAAYRGREQDDPLIRCDREDFLAMFATRRSLFDEVAAPRGPRSGE